MNTHFKLSSWITIWVTGLLLAGLWLIHPARAAGPWYVAPGGEDGDDCLSPATPCETINGAIGKATAGDTVYVAIGTYTSNAQYEVVAIDKDITLSGGWDETFTTQEGMSTIDGEGARRGVTVNTFEVAYLVLMDHFTIQNGFALHQGAGVFNNGVLTITNSIIMENTTPGDGGGVWNGWWSGFPGNVGGGLTLNNTFVFNNVARRGGGLYNLQSGTEDSAGGDVILNNSSVLNNTAESGGGIQTEDNYGYFEVILNNSTVSGNTATEYNGGGIYAGGPVKLNNSTVSGNSANVFGGGMYASDPVIISNSTVTGNTAGISGGGLQDDYGTISLQNTLIAGNSAEDTGPDCGGSPTSAGYNLIGTTSGCSFTAGTGDLTNVNSNLGQLIGDPGYHPLLSGSPAINAGDPTGCKDHLGNLLTTDQRGVARVGICDIGAYEYTVPGSPASISAFRGTPQHTPPSNPFAFPLQALVLDSIGSPVSNAAVTFSAPDSGASGIFADTGTISTTANTNTSGIVTASSFTANDEAGSYTANATVNGVISPAQFQLGNIAWYVAPNGNNSQDCQTPSTACATINGALDRDDFLPGDTVFVASGAYTGGDQEVVLAHKSAVLSGGWDTNFTVQSGMSTLDGNEIRRGVMVSEDVTVVMDRFIVQNGVLYDGGGGIYNLGGTVTLNNSIVRNNISTPAIYNGEGSMTLNNSTISENDSGISNSGQMIINNSTVSGNPSGGINNSGELTLNNSTVNGSGGVGISNNSGTLHLNSSTIRGHVLNGGDPNNPATTTVQNSILASCGNTLQSAGYNLIESAEGCNFNATTGDLLNIDAELWPSLVGTPGIHPLNEDSPAIDAGNPAGCKDQLGNLLNTDQRGVSRVGRCDIGAYEFDPANDPIHRSYLPTVSNNIFFGIYGRVTWQGYPINGIGLELRFFDGAAWSTQATATTTADGSYFFSNVPSLAPGQKYYVLYQNDEEISGALWVWGTRELTSYTSRNSVAIGDFDIADIPLVAPSDWNTIALPYTFQWVPRSASPTDVYELDIFDPSLDPYFFILLGYTESYTVNSLPGFSNFVPYLWNVWAYSPDGGFGISYDIYVVFFSNADLMVTTLDHPTLTRDIPEIETLLNR